MKPVLLCLLAGCFFSPVKSQQLPPYQFMVADTNLCAGYYFIYAQMMRVEKKDAWGYQLIFDGNGNVIYSRHTSAAIDFKMHPDGRLSFFRNGKVFLMDSLFRISDSVCCVNGAETDSHDFKILPNGHYLLIGNRTKEMDLSTYPVFLRKNAPGSKKAKVKYDLVQELDQDKHLVFEWNSEPYFKITDALPAYLQDSALVSMPHINSVATDAAGNIVASCRFFNELVKINRKTGKLIWRLGGVHNEFRFMNDSLPFLGQHDVHYLPNGNLLLYDNGYGIDPVKHNARAVEYRIDEAKKQVWRTWSYTQSPALVSSGAGSAERMQNGTTLLAFGAIENNRENIACTLVDSSGKIIFSLAFADTMSTYRAYGYPAFPFSLHRPVMNYSVHENYIEANAGEEPDCLWSTGESSPTIRISKPGVYYLLRPCDYGGFLWSEPLIVDDHFFDSLTK